MRFLPPTRGSSCACSLANTRAHRDIKQINKETQAVTSRIIIGNSYKWLKTRRVRTRRRRVCREAPLAAACRPLAATSPWRHGGGRR